MDIKGLINQTTLRLSEWRDRHNQGNAFMYFTAGCIGILSGAAAAALKAGIGFVKDVLFATLKVNEGNFLFFILPVVGIFVAMMFTRWIIRAPLNSATERIADDLSNATPRMKPKLIWGSIIGCSLTLGMGGSAGAESPIAYAGAAIGSNIGKAFRLSNEQLINLVGIGAGAGIAGIYMAPIGGVMFALEVIKMKQTLPTILSLTFCSLASALTCYILLGCHTDVSFVPEMRFDNHLIPYVLACGVVCGAYSQYYYRIMKWSSKFFGRFSNVWIKAAVGSAILAALLFMFPSLYGEGYNTIGKLMVNDATTIISYGPFYPLGKDFVVLMLLFVALLAVKPLATFATNDSGGVGGEFTPTFFCGAALGFMFATMLNHFFDLNLPYALFAFFGMAAVMAGSMRAPLMAIFIAAEMTGLYGFILPLTLCAVASFLTFYAINGLKMDYLHIFDHKPTGDTKKESQK